MVAPWALDVAICEGRSAMACQRPQWHLITMAEKLESEMLAKIKFTSAHVIDLDSLLCNTFVRQCPKALDYHNRRDLVRIFNTITKEIYDTRPSSTFVQHISLKLDTRNYLSWKQKVEGAICGYMLHRFLVNLVIPHHYLSEQACATDEVNPAYSEWEQQDSLLFTWLLSTLFDMILLRVVQCINSRQVWEEIHKFFHTQMNAKSRQAIVDVLLSIEYSMSNHDHLDAVLDGLLEEYIALAAIIQYCTEPYDILEVESMLLVYEAKLKKNKSLAAPLSINIA
ncbi:hypothetical protein CR513_43381, partial [Mucuna pruriens]